MINPSLPSRCLILCCLLFLPGGSSLLAANSEEALHAEPKAVPTFNCVGLYWKPDSGASGNTCAVHYRAQGSDDWREALPLWFDPSDHPGEPGHSREYRGSIVGLQSGTRYEIRLNLSKGGDKTLSVETWSERFPVARTVTIGPGAPQPLVIAEGGSPEKGYVVYESAPGVVLDGAGAAESNIIVNASHVILRGFTLKNAARHGIVLGDVTDVVIEACDISGWGRVAPDGFGVNLDSAIFSRSAALERIVVQDSRLHHPRSNSNSWTEPRTRDNGRKSKHPAGPQGITFMNAKGNFVIRRNRIFSDAGHKFNDGMGEVKNFSFAGFPCCDTDIHDNDISEVCDDGVEVEGADLNVRVWGNRFNDVYGAVGAATVSLGPLYIWRNVLGESRKGPGTDADSNKGAYLVKLGNENETFTKGKIFIFHNTMLQPPPRPGFTETSGGSVGIIVTAKTKHQSNVTSRNNIFFIRYPSSRRAINDPSRDPTNDFDHDLYTGEIQASGGAESHGINATPVFAPAADGSYPLAPGTPGIDAGVRLPDFNDDFSGVAPDMGAFEAAAPGVR